MSEQTRFLTGHVSYTRALRAEDIPSVARWSDDRAVTRYLFRGAYPSDLELAHAQWRASVDSPSDVEMALVCAADDVLVGIVGLHCINAVTRGAEFRVLIGEREYWGKGIGAESIQLLCAYGFEVLNLHKVWLGVTDANERALRTYEKTGFVREGVLRDEVFRNGRYYGAVRMSLLDTEYEEVKDTWPIADCIDRMFPR